MQGLIKTPCLSEATEFINEISVKLPSQFLIIKLTASFDKNFDQLSMNNSSEAAKFEPEPTFENIIIEIKDNHLRSIASAAKNPSAIIFYDNKIDPLCIKKIFEAEKFEPETTF